MMIIGVIMLTRFISLLPLLLVDLLHRAQLLLQLHPPVLQPDFDHYLSVFYHLYAHDNHHLILITLSKVTWNHILIWRSVRQSAWAISMRRLLIIVMIRMHIIIIFIIIVSIVSIVIIAVSCCTCASDNG